MISIINPQKIQSQIEVLTLDREFYTETDFENDEAQKKTVLKIASIMTLFLIFLYNTYRFIVICISGQQVFFAQISLNFRCSSTLINL